jgi:hypothetical protein
MVEFQENGYLTLEGLVERILRLQIRYIIIPSSIMEKKGEILTLKRYGDWSDFGTDSPDMFLKHFRIYTGDEDRFNWVSDKFEEVCKHTFYPFRRTEWGEDETL